MKGGGWTSGACDCAVRIGPKKIVGKKKGRTLKKGGKRKNGFGGRKKKKIGVGEGGFNLLLHFGQGA